MVFDSDDQQVDELVLEGIVVTMNDDGSPNISPMGPIVDRALTRFQLRPYQTSQTYINLKRTGAGVFHVIDDVLMLARAAVGQLQILPELLPRPAGAGWILADACRWYALRVDELDDSQKRVCIRCSVEEQGRLRDCFGWNRAKHAVLEAAILATRVSLLPGAQILEEFARLAIAVEKTAGRQEREAMEFLQQYLHQHCRP